MIIQDESEVTVIVRKNGVAKLCPFSLSNRSSFDGEVFITQLLEPTWLGFYDWLRTSDGDVIGICLRPDEGEVDADTLNTLLSLENGNSAHTIYIYFGSDRGFDPSLSDDADFGNNILFHGSMGSLAITFNAPAKR